MTTDLAFVLEHVLGDGANDDTALVRLGLRWSSLTPRKAMTRVGGAPGVMVQPRDPLYRGGSG